MKLFTPKFVEFLIVAGLVLLFVFWVRFWS